MKPRTHKQISLPMESKFDHDEDEAFRRKSRKRIAIILVSTFLLIAVIIATVAGTVIHKRNNNDTNGQQTLNSSAQAIKAVCSQTQYPDSCYSSITSRDKSNTTDPQQIFKLSLLVAFDSLTTLSSYPDMLISETNKANDISALNVCGTVLDEAADNLNDSISLVDVQPGVNMLSLEKIDDLRTWLSASLTNQETCLDTLEEMESSVLEQMKSQMENSTEYTSNSLAIITKMSGILKTLDIPLHRKLLGEMKSEFPAWVGAGTRRLLQDRPAPNVTVAKDGSGDVMTINDAMAMAPRKSEESFVIYIKEGEYFENVVLDKSFWNVMIYGDGMNKTVVSASLNKIDGVATFNTSTFGVSGKGFIAMDMGFRNTAGGIKEQAVALRSSSDFSVFYRCSFDAFQDTLYPHSKRQFYRDCNITGTVDFIFGNSAVVLQNCNIMPRQPLPNQFVTITAQGKKDINENTGISIQKCDITPLDNLTAPTYLGRPWKNYSTTVIMQSSIGGFLHPLGWAEWDRGVEPPSSIFYAEYQNTGPGSAVDQRVNWAGYKPRLTSAQAAKFNVRSFIDGSTWLPQTDVTFDST